MTEYETYVGGCWDGMTHAEVLDDEERRIANLGPLHAAGICPCCDGPPEDEPVEPWRCHDCGRDTRETWHDVHCTRTASGADH